MKYVFKKYVIPVNVFVNLTWDADKYPGDEEAQKIAEEAAAVRVSTAFGNDEVSECLESEVAEAWAEVD